MAKIIMVTSGKGGVGKSSICASVAYQLALISKKVLVLEMDSGLRCLDIMLGVNRDTVYDISDVLCGKCEPIKAIYKSAVSPNLFMMPATLRPGAGYSSELFNRLCRGLSHYYDFILIETPAGFGSALGDITRVADLAILVVTPDPISIRDARILSNYLDDAQLSNQRIVINKVKTTSSGYLEVLDNLDIVIDEVQEPLLGVVPYEPEVVRALCCGKMLSQRCIAGVALQNIARRLMGEFVELAMM